MICTFIENIYRIFPNSKKSIANSFLFESGNKKIIIEFYVLVCKNYDVIHLYRNNFLTLFV